MVYNIPDLDMYLWQHYFMSNLRRYNVLAAPRQVGKTEIISEIINTVAHAPNIERCVINLCSFKATHIYKLYAAKLNELFGKLDGFKYDNSKISDAKIKRSDETFADLNFIGTEAKPTGCTGTSPSLNVIDEANKVKRPFIFQSALPSTNKTEGITIIAGTWGENMEYYYEHAKRKMLRGDPYWFAMKFDFDHEFTKGALSERARDAIRSQYDLEDEDQKLIWYTEYMMKSGLKLTRFPYRDPLTKATIQNFSVDKSQPVNLAWDDGRGVTAIWAFQLIGGYFYLFDYVEFKKSDMVTITKNRFKWYNANEFKFGVQVMPHTMKEKTMALQSRISREAILKRELRGKGKYLSVPRVDSVETKLIAGRSLLRNCVFHPRANEGYERLRKYSRASIKNSYGIKVYQEKIDRNDPNSHGGDSFGEIALAHGAGKLAPMVYAALKLPHISIFNTRNVLYPY